MTSMTTLLFAGAYGLRGVVDDHADAAVVDDHEHVLVEVHAVIVGLHRQRQVVLARGGVAVRADGELEAGAVAQAQVAGVRVGLADDLDGAGILEAHELDLRGARVRITAAGRRRQDPAGPEGSVE
jgi:hypothetical protein